MAGQADSSKSVFFALFADSAIAIATGITACFTRSGAMLAGAIHRVEADIRQQAPITARTFFEPDLQDRT